MAKYRIVAARPKNASSHINSRFKMYQLNEKWDEIGWKSIGEVTDLMQAGHEVLTGKVVGNKMESGAPVEVELRITKNDTPFKISDMPDA
jgi:hypothetical protein